MSEPITQHAPTSATSDVTSCYYVPPVVTPAETVKALAKVMKALPSIGKDSKSPEGYSYRGIEAVTKHVQPLFAEHGIVAVPKARVTQVVASPAMKDGWQDVYLEVQWTIYGPDGSCITATTNGIGRDRSDKAANKAMTQAFKYLLLDLLCIADGKDDADSHTYEAGRVDPQFPPLELLDKALGERLDKLPAEFQAKVLERVGKAAYGRKCSRERFDALDASWNVKVGQVLDKAEEAQAAGVNADGEIAVGSEPPASHSAIAVNGEGGNSSLGREQSDPAALPEGAKT